MVYNRSHPYRHRRVCDLHDDDFVRATLLFPIPTELRIHYERHDLCLDVILRVPTPGEACGGIGIHECRR